MNVNFHDVSASVFIFIYWPRDVTDGQGCFYIVLYRFVFIQLTIYLTSQPSNDPVDIALQYIYIYIYIYIIYIYR